MSNTLDTLINKALETEKAKFSKIEEVSKEDENEFRCIGINIIHFFNTI